MAPTGADAGGDLPLGAPLDVEAALGSRPLRVLVVGAEAVPYLKTGGTADIVGALPHALSRMGHDVRLALPRYKSIDPERWQLRAVRRDLPVPISEGTQTIDILETTQRDGVRVAFVEAPHYFQREKLYSYNDDGERFILFCRATLEYMRAVGWAPDVIHCHDWHAAIIPNWMQTIYRGDPFFATTATVFTIHNLAYHGIFGYRILEVAGVAQEGFLFPELSDLANVVDLMGRGILFADVISTVSPSYAREILTPEFGERLDPLLRERKDRLYGILNGIDTTEFDPATDHSIAARYDAFDLDHRGANKRALQQRLKLAEDDRVPVIGMISRLTDQKGFDIVDQVAVPLLEHGSQLAVLGTGDHHYHHMLQRLAAHYPRQVAVHLTFSDEMSRAIYAGSDMLLMPSRFEPCGTTQMVAMRYGSIPIVHRTGGLADTVLEYDPATDEGTGFSFARYEPYHLFAALVRAMEVYKNRGAWRGLMQRAMLVDHSWDASAERYVALYRRAQELQQIAAARAAGTPVEQAEKAEQRG
jgi:starch synthase